eukprot:Gb_22022 [translate_table: standard]
MEDYPEELRTPPVALVSLVGVSELHSTISNFLHSEQPPINTLALPDFSKVSIIARNERETPGPMAPSKPTGILKSEWLRKHRTRVPAVVAALFSREHVYGDPAQWLQVCTNLDNLKTVIRGRNIKLVVVVVQLTNNDDVNEDRLVALRKRAEVDAKCFSIFVRQDPSELNRSLKRLGNIFGELSNAYYREEGRRNKLRIEKKNFNSIELNIRYNFKVAVYAEFRRDWVEALKFYQNAYTILQEMFNTPAELLPIQRLVEIKAVAEQLHFKVSTLLMHSGKGTDAIKWFRQHMDWYKRLVGPKKAAFLHWEWVSKQFLVFAELLQTSSLGTSGFAPPVSGMPELPVTEWEQQPGYYYELAAHYTRERRNSLKFASFTSEASENEAADVFQRGLETLGSPLYVGQYPQFIEHGSTLHIQSLTEAEFMRHAVAEEKTFQYSHAIIDLLMKAYDQYNLAKAGRMVYHVGSEMGCEYFIAGEFANAKRLFDSVTGIYRQEAWVTLLWSSLGYLKECARKLCLLKDYVEYALEMAALPISSSPELEAVTSRHEAGPAGPFSHLQRVKIYKEVIGLLQGISALPANGGSELCVTESQPILLEIDLVSPLRAVLLACVAFHEQVVKPGRITVLTLSLLTHLPLPIEIDELEIQFNQFSCNFVVVSEKGQVSAHASETQSLRLETVPDLQLEPNKWKRLSFNVNAGQSGKLECLSVIARVARNFTICCRAESPASREDLPLWKFEDRLETLPMRDSSLALFGQKVIQVEEPEPLVEIALSASGPGFVDEIFPVSVTVNSKGHAIHAGELKINIVDSKGGTITSPRETDSTFQSYNVELLTASSIRDDSERGIGAGTNYQTCSGLLALPFVDVGRSWSTHLFIKWHKPKLVTLFVSLGYYTVSPDVKEEASQKVHVHRSLQIEGRTSITMSHQYMTPFRRDSLLLTNIQRKLASDSPVSLALNETDVLMVTVKNSSELPLRLISITVEEEDSCSCSVSHASATYDELHTVAMIDSECHHSEPASEGGSSTESDHALLLMPDETFRIFFSVRASVASSALGVGTVWLRWKRDIESGRSFSHAQVNGDSYLQPLVNLDLPKVTTTRIKLSPISVEKPPLVVSLECPSHALLGAPFILSLRIQNETAYLQEVKFSLVDSQSFLLSGAHSDTICILPYSSHVLSYKLVALASGLQQLPQVMLTASRYKAGFQLPPASGHLFVFPSTPHLKLDLPSSGEGIVSSGLIHAK